MKVNSLKSKQVLLGVPLALALGATIFARTNGQSWTNSLLLGAGAFTIASMITRRKTKNEEDFKSREAMPNAEVPVQIHNNALLAWEQGDTDGAFEMMSSLKENHSYYLNNTNACFFLGSLLRLKGRHEESYPYLERFVQSNPNSEQALLSLAECLVDIRKFEEAIKVFTRALEINTENSRTLFNRGVAYASLDNLSYAYRDWEAASVMSNEGADKLVKKFASHISEEISADNYALLLEKAKKYRNDGELIASKTSYDKAINVGIQLLKKNIEINLATAYQGRGTTQLLAGNNSLAIEDYSKSESYSDRLPPAISANYAKALSLIGKNYEAIKYYDQAIECEPTQLTYFERGNAKSSINDADGAITDYTASIKLNIDQEITWKSYVNRGCLKARKYELLDAEQDLLAGLELNPRDPIAREWLARTYSELKRYDQAFEELSTILNADNTYWDAYRLRGLLSLSRYAYEPALVDLKTYAENCGEDEEVQDKINYIEQKLQTLIAQDELLNPSDNLEEWRKAHALLSLTAAYIQACQRYIDALDPGEAADTLNGLINKLQADYHDQLRISAKYKDAYYLFRLRNLTYATMAVNMNGERLENREAFGKYFHHSVFDDADTILREVIRGDEIDRQIDRANVLENYIVYGCSIYCNKLLNLIDGGFRQERDTGKNYDKYLEIQSSLEDQRNVDEIYVVRQAMIWTIASTNIALVTSSDKSNAFEAKAFNLLSRTNQYGSDYGNGPYRREDILSALCHRWEWGRQLSLQIESISSSEYQEKLHLMTDEQLSAQATVTDSSLDMRKFLNRWGQASRDYYGIDHLRQAVINDYAYLCYEDGGTQPNEISLEAYKKQVAAMSVEDLVSETSIIEIGISMLDALVDYIELWLNYSEYANYDYELTSEGGTILRVSQGCE